jgi:hypothetical protein
MTYVLGTCLYIVSDRLYPVIVSVSPTAVASSSD